MKKSLGDIQREYEKILHSDWDINEKDRRYADLMTEMEKEFQIPIFRDHEFEKNNKAVIALYRKISMSRSL